MAIKVRAKISKFDDVEIDQEQAIYAIEQFILERVPSLRFIDHITEDGKKMEVDDVDYHTGHYFYKETGDASEEEIKAYQLISDIKKLLHSTKL